MAVEADDFVEQLGAKAVHHTHDYDQGGDPQRHGQQADRSDEEDEPLTLAGQKVAAGEHSLGAVEDHRRGSTGVIALGNMVATTSTARSTGRSSRWPLRRFLVSIMPWATDFGPTMNCRGRPMTS